MTSGQEDRGRSEVLILKRPPRALSLIIVLRCVKKINFGSNSHLDFCYFLGIKMS